MHVLESVFTSGKDDDPNESGDVPNLQALTTALSATVGIGALWIIVANFGRLLPSLALSAHCPRGGQDR